MLFPSSDHKYEIIYADPPWTYKDLANGNGARGGALLHYPCMSLNHIKILPVSHIVSNDACLFLWVTMPLLQEGLDVIKSWGFTYKTCAFSWIKQYKNGSLFFGLGRWTRGNVELCLLATRGKPTRISASVPQVTFSQIRKHSQKPDIIKDKIIQLLGDLPRIELFAREQTDGWDFWGNDPNLQEFK